jgi:anti-anti-sigma factor
MMLAITEKQNGIYVITIEVNEVHTLDIPELKERLQYTIIEKNMKRVILNLENIRMITSSGIGIFLYINQGLKSNLKLAGANEEVKRVLDLTKVTTVIKLYETIDQAIESFS